MNEAEQRGYEVGIAEIEEALRAEVPEVCRTYCARTWNVALDRAGIEASSELRRPESIFYPEAIRPSTLHPERADAPSTVVTIAEEVLPRNSPPRDQLEPARKDFAQSGVSSEKNPTVSEAKAASSSFQRELDSTVLPTGGTSQAKDEIAPLKPDLSARIHKPSQN